MFNVFKNVGCFGVNGTNSNNNFTSLSPAWLTTELKKIYGSSIVGLWVGEDLIVNGSNNVTSWPGRVGGPLTNGTANLFPTSIINNRRAAGSADATNYKYLISAGVVAAKSIISVATTGPLPFTTYRYLANSTAPGEQAIIGVGSTLWTTGGAITYVNGTLTNSVTTTTLQVFEGIWTPGFTGNLIVGSYTTNQTQNWQGTFGCVLALSIVQSPEQRVLVNQILRGYYNL
jgi:hypothetical protein